MRFDFELNLPRLQGEGQYDINGQILTLPLKGNGPFTGNFSKLNTLLTKLRSCSILIPICSLQRIFMPSLK